MDSTRRGIQSLRSSVIQLNASISDYKGWSFAQSYSLFDWFKKNLQKPLDRPDGEVKLIVAWLLALSHAALRAVSMFSTTLFDSNLFFWLTLVSVVIFFKRPSTGKHSLTIWEYVLTGVEVREKKGSNYSEQGTKVENTQMSEPNGCFIFHCLLCFHCCCFQWLSVRAHLLSGRQLPCLFIVTFHRSWCLLWVSGNQT